MREQIANIPTQFSWEPECERTEQLLNKTFEHTFLYGMGGSHLGADLLLREAPTLPFTVRHEYGATLVPEKQHENTLVIISSYSGETEEVLDVLHEAQRIGMSCAVMTSGGTLLERARKTGIPAIIFPTEGVEPRMTLGYELRGIAYLLQEKEIFKYIAQAGNELSDIETIQKSGIEMVDFITNKIPVFYTSTQNTTIGYILKIMFNESAKIPSFTNTIPEACHNELSGYDAVDASRSLIHSLLPIFITDVNDHPRIRARMNLMRELLAQRDISTYVLEIPSDISALAGGITVLRIGAYAAMEIADRDNAPDAKTKLITEFKKRLAEIPW